MQGPKPVWFPVCSLASTNATRWASRRPRRKWPAFWCEGGRARCSNISTSTSSLGRPTTRSQRTGVRPMRRKGVWLS
eukprot:10155084-Lingulodinium_polyedra.AAC.1